MKTGQRIFRNSFILIFQSSLALLISLLINGYVAKKLGPSDYGKFVFAFSFATLFSFFTDMGFYGWSVKEIARYRNKTSGILGDLVIVRGFFSLVVLFCIGLVINILDYPPSTRLAVYIAATSLILLAPQFTNAWIIFEAHEKVRYEGTSNVLSRVLVGALSVYLMYTGYGFIALSLAYLSGTFIQIIYCYYVLKKEFVLPQIEVSISKYLSQMKMALPFAFFGFFYVIYYEIDKTMLSLMVGDAAVGLYNAATAITYKGGIISGSIATAILPAMIRWHGESKEKLANLLARIIPILLIIGLPIAIVCTTFAEEIINIIYRSPDYKESILTLRIIIWMVPLEFLSHILRFSLIAADRQGIVTWSAGIGVAFNVLLNILLISSLKQNGAAIATVATEALILIYQFYYFSKNISKIPVGRKVGYSLVSNAILFAVFYCLKGSISYYTLPLGFGIYLGALALLRCLSKEDLETFGMAGVFRSIVGRSAYSAEG